VSATLSEMNDDFYRYLRMAESEGIVITHDSTAARVLIGFESEGDWFDYRLKDDPRFIERIASAKASLGGKVLESLSVTGPGLLLRSW
jgi:hypothetical protein